MTNKCPGLEMVYNKKRKAIMDNYWSDEKQQKGNSTEHIKEAIIEQSKYLEQETEGVVKGRFGIVKNLVDVVNAVNAMSVLMKGRIDVGTDDDISPDFVDEDLEDANILYETHRYGYEIYNAEYKYRLFSINMGPLYPVFLEIENESLNSDEIREFGIVINKDNKIEINNDEEFDNIFKIIIKSKKVRYIYSELNK